MCLLINELQLEETTTRRVRLYSFHYAALPIYSPFSMHVFFLLEQRGRDKDKKTRKRQAMQTGQSANSKRGRLLVSSASYGVLDLARVFYLLLKPINDHVGQLCVAANCSRFVSWLSDDSSRSAMARRAHFQDQVQVGVLSSRPSDSHLFLDVQCYFNSKFYLLTYLVNFPPPTSFSIPEMTSEVLSPTEVL